MVWNTNTPLFAIVGRPNVGKSTLFNRLTGKKKALVLKEPGITRDRHYEETNWLNVPFRLVDTAGVELSNTSRLQNKMTEQANVALKEAHAILFVLDGRDGLTTLEREWHKQLLKLGKPIFYCINKIDSQSLEANLSDFYPLGAKKLIAISAETGRCISELLDEMIAFIHKNKLLQEETPEKKHFSVSLVGRPNVGKSTLLNQLLGEERSIADETPGTTRDPINTYIKIDGQDYCLIDTAGIRRKGRVSEAIEKFSVIKSLKVIEESDAVLMLLDSVEGVTDQDAHVLGEAFELSKLVLIVVNKWDEGIKNKTREEFEAVLSRKMSFAQYIPKVFISAKTGKGISKIFPTLARLRAQFEMRIPTGVLNRSFEKIVHAHPLPVHAGKNIKIFYATQAGVSPPTFVVFSNSPAHIHFSYKRYLVNAIKEAFGFNEVPVKLIFKKRDSNERA